MRQVNFVSLAERRIYLAEVTWEDGLIAAIVEIGVEDPGLGYLIPGFIDAHVHIESAMLPPAEFGRLALRHGTVAVVSDPHEIANVLGVEGVRFMLENARKTPFHVFFGAPSCVPATPFETADGDFGCDEIAAILDEPEVCCLSEMMNYPGVLARDPGVMAKIDLAASLGYPVDGHAPGLKGEAAAAYVGAGITTDHECISLEEARGKIAAGMSVLIREGSAARNFDTLHPLISESTGQVMLCSDDKHPDDLLRGHINGMAARAVANGYSVFDVLRCACINPIDHYSLPLSRLEPGDRMDAVEVADLLGFLPVNVWLDGSLVARDGKVLLKPVEVVPVNVFKARKVKEADLSVVSEAPTIRVIGVRDGSLVTRERLLEPRVEQGMIVPDIERDILPVCVVNRYQPAAPALGFIQGFGLKKGAVASSVAHDSHNIIAVSADVVSMARVVNGVIDHRGGVAVMDGGQVHILPLPIAGIMSDDDGERVGQFYGDLDRRAKALGSGLSAPFMTLSFMALLVIPELKLSDQGLFDGRTFEFTSVGVI
ncbi:MAG: adenine deaminase [Gammaproteobacteria bacterium]|nr:adenine deaminase [Gammaproteobacteria bacterium]